MVERRTGQPADTHRAADLTSRAWELLATRPDLIVGAANPWGYLTRCLLTAGINAAVAERLLVRDVVVQGGGVSASVAPQRVGEHIDILDRAPVQFDGCEPVGSDWDAALKRLHTDLVTAGAPAQVTAAAIDRVIDVVATHRRGHREAAVKRDRALAGIGLTPRQTTALLALVGGTRRGGPDESLWARLRDETGRHAAVLTPAVQARIDEYIRGFYEAMPATP